MSSYEAKIDNPSQTSAYGNFPGHHFSSAQSSTILPGQGVRGGWPDQPGDIQPIVESGKIYPFQIRTW